MTTKCSSEDNGKAILEGFQPTYSDSQATHFDVSDNYSEAHTIDLFKNIQELESSGRIKIDLFIPMQRKRVTVWRLGIALIMDG
ncbi:hypothetical protein [Dasania marina]|uniref:hypothetical protein n=1 Tax=Dasania marina TaxID=471499 RepID=UPI0030D9607B|tara:strand:- start:2128 stop:2379 length:252 start_codon:yes stop_codon:yes gene_type:complete